MQEELQSIEANNTWELVPRPSHRKIIGVKWIYEAKFHYDGSLDKYKACLVARGYVQKEVVNYDGTLFFHSDCANSLFTICLVYLLAGC